MRNWIRRRLPTQESLRAQPGLRWLGPLLRRPWLWQMNRRSVALGAGIGVFFGFMVPVAQILGAAGLALLLRANLPVAALATLVSNPVTFAPIVYLAHRTGSAVLGETPAPGAAEAITSTAAVEPQDWLARIGEIGKPLFVGLAVFGVVGGIATWALVYAGWTLAVWLKRRRRRPREGA